MVTQTDVGRSETPTQIEMTREDYLNKGDQFPELPVRTMLLVQSGLADFDEVVGQWHRRFIKDAIERNENVPLPVLQEYYNQ